MDQDNSDQSELKQDFIFAIQMGLSFLEAFDLFQINQGILANWVRWDPEFKENLNAVRDEGVAKRRILKTIRIEQNRMGKRWYRIPNRIQAIIEGREIVKEDILRKQSRKTTD